MSHLHIPDGILPVLLWAPGLVAAIALLFLSARALRHAPRRQLGYQGALGALVLAAMAITVPLGPLGYHLSLVGPVGVLLGPASAYQVVFVVSGILALAGHGGLTAVGLNALVLGAGAAVARPCYRALAGAVAPPAAMAIATVLSQIVSGALWLLVVSIGAGTTPAAGGLGGHVHDAGEAGVLAGVALPLLALGLAIEGFVSYGMARFLARARPDLLPGPTRRGRTAEGVA
jgi:cobalt/nickel transport system permease protein